MTMACYGAGVGQGLTQARCSEKSSQPPQPPSTLRQIEPAGKPAATQSAFFLHSWHVNGNSWPQKLAPLLVTQHSQLASPLQVPPLAAQPFWAVVQVPWPGAARHVL